MIEGVFNRGFKVTERALDIRMARQQLLSSAVANIDTPGFRALDVDFGESLRRMMEHEDAVAAEGAARPGRESIIPGEELQEPSLKVVGVDGLFIGPDSNSANLEMLMGRIQENSTLYKVAAEMMAAKFRKLQTLLDGVSR